MCTEHLVRRKGQKKGGGEAKICFKLNMIWPLCCFSLNFPSPVPPLPSRVLTMLTFCPLLHSQKLYYSFNEWKKVYEWRTDKLLKGPPPPFIDCFWFIEAVVQLHWIELWGRAERGAIGWHSWWAHITGPLALITPAALKDFGSGVEWGLRTHKIFILSFLCQRQFFCKYCSLEEVYYDFRFMEMNANHVVGPVCLGD